jgi:hypothetical protein
MREHPASEIRSGAPDGIWLRRQPLGPVMGSYAAGFLFVVICSSTRKIRNPSSRVRRSSSDEMASGSSALARMAARALAIRFGNLVSSSSKIAAS